MSAELDCGSDAAAYVLGALDETGAEVFRRHMNSCAACRDEVLALQQAADALPQAVTQFQAPAALRKRVMAEVRAEAAAVHADRPGWRPGWRDRLRVPRPALAGLVAVIAVAIVTVTVSSSPAGTRIVRAAIAWQRGTAVVKLTDGHGQLFVEGMPGAPAGKVYEVWLKRGSAAPQATNALFEVTAAGRAAVDVPGNLSRVTTVMVTAERNGGSRVPHGHPLLVANL
jgi:anti-sigma-K factor RskA